MKAKIGYDGLDRCPHNINANAWYYEGTGGIRIYVQSVNVGTVRWESLRASLKRHDNAKKKSDKVTAKKPRKVTK